MKISVIGTINKDLILPFSDIPIESFGGIYYTTSVLAHLLGPEDTIVPVSYVGEDILVNIEAVLKRLPNVSMNGLVRTAERNHKVILEYKSPEERAEKSLFPFPSLTWQQIAPHTDADMLIVNMISGWDLETEAFFKLAENCRERLYLDIHYLLMGVDNLGRRFIDRPVDVERWIRAPRFLQMNEREFDVLAGESRNEQAFYQEYCEADQVLIITRGSKGATIVYDRQGMTAKKQVPGFTIPRLVDTTGCGDSFGAAFCVRYLQSQNITEAVRYANLVAGAKASLKGTNEMYQLREVMKIIESGVTMTA